jgi:hypothetical protein
VCGRRVVAVSDDDDEEEEEEEEEEEGGWWHDGTMAGRQFENTRIQLAGSERRITHSRVAFGQTEHATCHMTPQYAIAEPTPVAVHVQHAIIRRETRRDRATNEPTGGGGANEMDNRLTSICIVKLIYRMTCPNEQQRTDNEARARNWAGREWVDRNRSEKKVDFNPSLIVRACDRS